MSVPGLIIKGVCFGTIIVPFIVIRPLSSTAPGRFVLGENWGFLVKISNDIPKSQSECFDISRDHPDSEIGVVQSYNSESKEKPLLRYGEIELQLNLFKTVDNASHGKAKHQLFGYIGSKDEILNIMEKFLGISNPKLF